MQPVRARPQLLRFTPLTKTPLWKPLRNQPKVFQTDPLARFAQKASTFMGISRVHFRGHFHDRVRGSNFAVRVLCAFRNKNVFGGIRTVFLYVYVLFSLSNASTLRSRSPNSEELCPARNAGGSCHGNFGFEPLLKMHQSPVPSFSNCSFL